MSGFDSGWLALREPADSAARRPELATRLAAWLPRAPLRVLDLGCGTGASLRWLAPRLPLPQRWELLDHDADLLAALPERLAGWARDRGDPVREDRGGLSLGAELHVRWRRHDLARSLPAPGDAALVSASALADLVSREWLASLVRACAASRAAVLLALTYDGRMAFRPWHAGDARVRDAVNRHQLRDKGFGPALGPGAAAAAAALLRAAGYRVIQQRSDWTLDAGAADLAEELLGQWSELAAHHADGPPGWVARWLESRLQGGLITVGHVDLLALPPT